jgi:glycosyltransferase involved in cell wall biosynthesis
MLEVMAAGGVVVGSATPPVAELIQHGRNGWLVDFFDTDALANRLSTALAQRNDSDPMRRAARQTVVDGFALTNCLQAQIALLDGLTGGK